MRRRIAPISLGLLACLCLAPVAASADVVQFAAGRELEGIVVSESPSQLQIRIAWQGYLTVDKKWVVSIVRSDEQSRRRLLDQWRQEFVDDQQREQQRRAFEAAQHDKGLVHYLGQWITRDELAAITAYHQAQTVSDERRRQSQEIERLTQRITALEEENQRLQQQLTERPSVVVVPPTTVEYGARIDRFVVDEHGNRLRVRWHDGHECFTGPHGTHTTIRFNSGRWLFNDSDGVAHEVVPAQP